MRVDDLARILKEAYDKAPNRDKSAAVCLFGVRYAEQIGTNTNAIISKAGIGNYGPMADGEETRERRASWVVKTTATRLRGRFRPTGAAK